MTRTLLAKMILGAFAVTLVTSSIAFAGGGYYPPKCDDGKIGPAWSYQQPYQQGQFQYQQGKINPWQNPYPYGKVQPWQGHHHHHPTVNPWQSPYQNPYQDPYQWGKQDPWQK